MDAVERVARAMCAASGTEWGGPRGEDDPDFMLPRMAYMTMARAAIEAMPGSIFQDLHDSEIGFKIEVLYDGMFSAQIGTERGSPRAEAVLSDWQTLEYWLRQKAIELYPDSRFAEKYRTEAL